MKNKTSITRKLGILFYAMLVAVIFCRCSNNNSEQQSDPLNKVQNNEYGKTQVLTIDNCEYITWNWSYAGSIIHKQNCKYCVERSKK